jgi:hypothetical protein
MEYLEVGKPYNPNRQEWHETVQYNFRGQHHELVLFFNSPSSREVEAVKRGSSEFALTVEPPLIVLCYRFGDGIPWSDAPYSYHLVPADERGLPVQVDAASGSRAFLLVLLVDAETGILRAIRQVSFSPEFTDQLHRAIREQALSTWDEAEYDLALSDLYRYRSTEDLVKTALVRCSGGD